MKILLDILGTISAILLGFYIHLYLGLLVTLGFIVAGICTIYDIDL